MPAITPVRVTKLDVVLASILAGPLTALEVAGRTPNLFWVDIVVATMAGWAIATLCVRGRPERWRLPSVIWCALAYVAVCAASLTMTEDPLASIAIFKLRVMPVIAFLLACRAPGSREVRERFFRSVVVFGFALALIGLYNWYRFSTGSLVLSDEFGPKDMLQTSFGRSNYIASLLIIIVPLGLLYTRFADTTTERVFFGVATATMLTALTFTQSRGGIISLIVGLAVWVAITMRRGAIVRTSAFVIAGVGALIAVVAGLWSRIPPDLQHGFDVGYRILVSQIQEGNYGGNRTELWLAAIRGALDSRLMGIGLGNQGGWFMRAQLTASAHNVYLETLLETGVVGLLAFLGILLSFGRILSRLRRTVNPLSRALAAALIASFVAALVNVIEEPSFWAPQYGYLFWMMMGVAYSAGRMTLHRQAALGTEVTAVMAVGSIE